MKIGIDIRETGNNKAGKGYYAFHLTRALLSLDKNNRYTLYTDHKTDNFNDFDHAHVHHIAKKGLWWHKKALSDIYKRGLDLFIAPTSYIIPAFHNPNKLRVLMTVHDLIAFLYPKQHNKKAVLTEKITLKRALKKSYRILSVSENTKKDLIKLFHTPDRIITIIPNAASDIFGVMEPEACASFKEQHNLPKTFIFSVGTLEPRKNYPTLLKAFAKIAPYYPDLHLVIAGKKGWQSNRIFETAEKLAIQHKVHFLGYVDEEELAILYNLAHLFVYPSLYEGFGIPPLESMKCGCPVITSNTSSLPEVVDDAALCVDPADTAALADTMHTVLNKPSLRESLIQKGLKHHTRFSWELSARKLLAIINEV
ncbi:glycosyltransferase [Candidatus Peregrinibacteria bacterium]|nr:glycosyltransferase [Candidatus Peregrinibacteria bacterium]